MVTGLYQLSHVYMTSYFVATSSREWKSVYEGNSLQLLSKCHKKL